MFKKSTTTKVIVASIQISGFKVAMEKLNQYAMVNGLSKKTIECYSRKLANLSLHFKKIPELISEDELRDYFSKLIQQDKGNSQSEFKHTIYGMRLYFKLVGKPINVKLPQIKKRTKLPTVLSKEEFKSMLSLTKNFKHRLILMTIYSCGLRMNELLNLKWSDVDAGRMMIHIRQSKGNRDRYVPLSANLLSDLALHVMNGSPSKYVFSGSGLYPKMSVTGIRFLLKEAIKRSGIIKEGICVHTLRHSYATHLLEDGLDIVSIKELLGHFRLESTLVYLHVADYNRRNKISPLDTLLGEISEEEKTKQKEKYVKLISNRNIVESNFKEQLKLF